MLCIIATVSCTCMKWILFSTWKDVIIVYHRIRRNVLRLSRAQSWPYVACSVDLHFWSIYNAWSTGDNLSLLFSSSMMSLVERESWKARWGHLLLVIFANNCRKLSLGFKLEFRGSKRFFLNFNSFTCTRKDGIIVYIAYYGSCTLEIHV